MAEKVSAYAIRFDAYTADTMFALEVTCLFSEIAAVQTGSREFCGISGVRLRSGYFYPTSHEESLAVYEQWCSQLERGWVR